MITAADFRTVKAIDLEEPGCSSILNMFPKKSQIAFRARCALFKETSIQKNVKEKD